LEDSLDETTAALAVSRSMTLIGAQPMLDGGDVLSCTPPRIPGCS
jgi:hypothetical protein